MDFSSRVRKLLGMEREKTIEEEVFERVEEAKWQNTMKKLNAICEAEDVDFQIKCTHVENCDKEEKKVSEYEEKLNRLGLNTKERSMKDEGIMKFCKTEEDRLNKIIEAEEIEFVPAVYYRFIDGKLKLSVAYDVVIIEKEENREEEEVVITLNIDSKSFEHKPDKKEIAGIQKRMASNKKQITMPEFIEAIEQGRSFKAAALNGNKNIDWESQQVFALDVDNDEKVSINMECSHQKMLLRDLKT